MERGPIGPLSISSALFDQVPVISPTPGFKHHTFRVRRTLANDLSYQLGVRRAFAAPGPLTILAHREKSIF